MNRIYPSQLIAIRNLPVKARRSKRLVNTIYLEHFKIKKPKYDAVVLNYYTTLTHDELDKLIIQLQKKYSYDPQTNAATTATPKGN